MAAAPAGETDNRRRACHVLQAASRATIVGVKLGLCLPHRAVGAAAALEVAVHAEELGYDSVWVSELATYDAYALSCAIAARTTHITIGTAIVPVTTRTRALHAMSVSTFGHLAPDRSIVGFGISTEPIIGGWHEQPGVVNKALTHTRALSDFLDGDMNSFRLEAPAPLSPKRYIGALGPRMCAFAREHADGLILNFAPRSALKDNAGTEDFEVTLPVRIAYGGADAERRFRRESASYLRVPAYEQSIADQGYPDVVEQGPLQEMADALPDEFVHDMGILEDHESALAKMLDDGVTPLLVPIVAPGDLDDFRSVMRAAVT